MGDAATRVTRRAGFVRFDVGVGVAGSKSIPGPGRTIPTARVSVSLEADRDGTRAPCGGSATRRHASVSRLPPGPYVWKRVTCLVFCPFRTVFCSAGYLKQVTLFGFANSHKLVLVQILQCQITSLTT